MCGPAAPGLGTGPLASEQGRGQGRAPGEASQGAWGSRLRDTPALRVVPVPANRPHASLPAPVSPLFPTCLCSHRSHGATDKRTGPGLPVMAKVVANACRFCGEAPPCSGPCPAPPFHLRHPTPGADLQEAGLPLSALLPQPTRRARLRRASLRLGEEQSMCAVSPRPASAFAEGGDRVFSFPVRSPPRGVVPWHQAGAVERRNDGRRALVTSTPDSSESCQVNILPPFQRRGRYPQPGLLALVPWTVPGVPNRGVIDTCCAGPARADRSAASPVLSTACPWPSPSVARTKNGSRYCQRAPGAGWGGARGRRDRALVENHSTVDLLWKPPA